MKPLSTQPILIDGTTIANAYEWSFGWCAEWVHWCGEELVPQPFSVSEVPGKHEVFPTFEALKAELLAYRDHRNSQGLKMPNPMTPTVEVVFYGASDDNIEIEGPIEGADEYGTWLSRRSDGTGIVGVFLLEGYGGAMHIYCIYDGVWAFAIGQTEEDATLPPWPVSLSAAGYTTKLTLTVPVGTCVSKVGDDDE